MPVHCASGGVSARASLDRGQKSLVLASAVIPPSECHPACLAMYLASCSPPTLVSSCAPHRSQLTMIEAMTATQSVRGRNQDSPNQEDLVLMERFARYSLAGCRPEIKPSVAHGHALKAAVANTTLSKFESYRATRRR